MKKTAAKVEEEVMTRILSGEAYADISRDTNVAVSTIKKIKKRNYEAFYEAESTSKRSIIDEMRIANMRAMQAINHVLDKDQEGEITLTIKELLAISHEMYKHTAIYSTPVRYINSPNHSLQ